MAGYIGSSAAVSTSGTERKKTFAITTSTTSLTGLVYTPNFVHVYHNGIRLVDGTDFTATNGTSITLTNAAETGDEVVVVSYATFSPADAYTKAEADAEFVQVAGDTMTGALTGTDLTLSGGVYLGGTGAANKLDDVETGTWTPIYYDETDGSELAGVVYNGRRYGRYTKIGNMVTINFQIITSSMTLTGSSTNQVSLGGLPFSLGVLNASDSNADFGDTVVPIPSGFNDSPLYVEGSLGDSRFRLRVSDHTDFTIADMQTGNFDNSLRGSITYKTDA